MSEFPRELIRQVQISTRSAAGLSSYDPNDPTLPALPSLSAAIATLEPSPLHFRCKQCKAKLLRGLQSNICVYCGARCQNDAVPVPICFNSTIGYRWLLGSLGLDGSEMVKLPTSKNEQDQGQRSRKAETPLSDFLNFSIAWPTETKKQETKQSEETKPFWFPTGNRTDNFFFKTSKVGTSGTKAVAALDSQNLFQNVDLTESISGSAIDKFTESEWQADFEFAVSDSIQSVTKSSDNIMASSDDSGNKIQDSQSSHFMSSQLDLSAHMDSVFGNKDDLIDGKPTDYPVASPALGDRDSDDLWTNMSGNESQLVGGFEATVSAKDPFENLDNLSTSADLFQDFQGQTNDVDALENKTRNGEHDTMDDSQTVGCFGASLNVKDDLALGNSNNLSTSDDFQDFQWQTNETDMSPSKTFNEEPGTKGGDGPYATGNAKDEHNLVKSNDLSADMDLFQDFQWQTSKPDTSENKTMNEENDAVNVDAFDEWNDFTGSASLQDSSQNAGNQINQLSTSQKNSWDVDLFSLDSKFDERETDGFSEHNLVSTSAVNKNPATERAISLEPSLNRLSETDGPSSDSAPTANNANEYGKSTCPKGDVQMLISQMRDLSFMLKTDLSIPTASDSQNSANQD